MSRRVCSVGPPSTLCPPWLGIWFLSNFLVPDLHFPVFCTIHAEIFEVLLKCHAVLDFSIFTASFLLFFIPLRWLTPADLYRFSSGVPASRKASVLLGSFLPSLGRLPVSPMLLWPCAYCMELPQVSGYQRDPTWLWLSLRLTVNKDPITLISVWGQQLTESSHSICIHGTGTDTAFFWFCLFYLVLSFGLQRAQQALESVRNM